MGNCDVVGGTVGMKMNLVGCKGGRFGSGGGIGGGNVAFGIGGLVGSMFGGMTTGGNKAGCGRNGSVDGG